ncbi:MAG: hypothetical protein AAF141_07860 [Pseudomonadota bacterium]
MKPKIGLAALMVWCAAIFAQVLPGYAQTLGEEPRRGSVERTQLLNTVRPAAELELGLPVEFVVRHLRVDGPWAFLAGDMQKPGGVAIQCEEIRHPGDCGLMDGFSIFALLSRQGDRWRLRDMHIAPTDVSWSSWPDAYGVPCQLVLPDTFCR